jgi:hypothetical protein
VTPKVAMKNFTCGTAHTVERNIFRGIKEILMELKWD